MKYKGFDTKTTSQLWSFLDFFGGGGGKYLRFQSNMDYTYNFQTTAWNFSANSFQRWNKVKSKGICVSWETYEKSYFNTS